MGVALGMPQPVQAARMNVVKEAAEKLPVDPADKEIDRRGIQSVLDKAKDSDKVLEVYFPAGDYYVDSALRVYSNTHIILDDKATIHRTGGGINKNILHNVDADGEMGVVGGYDMSHDIIIEGGTFDGGDVSSASTAADVMRIDHAQDVTIKNCHIKNVYDCHLLELIGVKNGVVENCTFSDFYFRKGQEDNYIYAREALQLETAWTNTESNPQAEAWANNSVIDGTSCRSVRVTKCKFDNVPCGVGQHHYTKSGKYRNEDIEISNNVLTYNASAKNGKTAITCCGTNNLRVQGNKISGYHFGIHMEEADEVSITNNTFRDIQMNGIMIDSGKVKKILGNNLQKIGKHGISCGGGTIQVIEKNTISNSGQNGICVDDGTIKNIRNNAVKTAKKSGISVVGGNVGSGKKKNAGLIKNKISGCKLNGITISGKGAVSSVAKNQIKNVKNNGISLTEKAKVAWVINNKISKYGSHDIWNGLSGKVSIKQ